MNEDIPEKLKHPADVVKLLKQYPESFLSLGKPLECVRNVHGVKSRYTKPRYQWIRPGEDYECRPVDEKAFLNLEESHDLKMVENKHNRWRLK